MSEPISALAGAATGAGHYISIAEQGPVAQVTLKADLGAPGVAAALEAATGLALPAPLSVVEGEGGRAVWMAPDELLILLPAGRDAAASVAALEEGLAGAHALALDVSDARTVFRLEGAAVAEVLAKCLPVDLRPAAFPVGTARRTHLGEVAVGVWRLSETDWEMVAFRSYAHYVFEWLSVASADGGEVGFF